MPHSNDYSEKSSGHPVENEFFHWVPCDLEHAVDKHIATLKKGGYDIQAIRQSSSLSEQLFRQIVSALCNTSNDFFIAKLRLVSICDFGNRFDYLANFYFKFDFDVRERTIKLTELVVRYDKVAVKVEIESLEMLPTSMETFMAVYEKSTRVRLRSKSN
jgi:hypothetical protein